MKIVVLASFGVSLVMTSFGNADVCCGAEGASGVKQRTSNVHGEKLVSEPNAARVIEDASHSKVLGRDKNFTVILPKGYTRNTSREYPVLYIFHGRGRNERTLVDASETRTSLMKSKCLVVLPDGDDNWYIDSPVDKRSRYGSYIEELMRYVEGKYRVSKDRKRRGVAGWSMGGYGSAMFAETHPEQFFALAPIIALLDYPREGLPEGQSYPVQRKWFGNDPDAWKTFNPINNAGKLRGMKLLVITGKKCFTLTMNRNFVSRLKELGIPANYIELEGGHTFATVAEALPLMVDFMNRTIASDILN